MTEGEPTPQTRAAARAAAGSGSAESPASATPPTAGGRRRSGRSASGRPTSGRLGWVRAASDRVPTTWFAGAATVVFLGATAAFGGLATAAEPGPSTIEPGTEHRNEQFALTVENALLRDADPDAGIYLEDGERLLSIRVMVENLWTQPQSPSDVLDNLTFAELDADAISAVRRVDDDTLVSRLQPNVPAEIEFRWKVGTDDFRDGDTLQLTLNDLSVYTGSFVVGGSWWTDPEPAAHLTLVVDDAEVSP